MCEQPHDNSLRTPSTTPMRGLIDATKKVLRYSQATGESQPTIYSAQTKLKSGYRVGRVQLNGF